MFSSPFADDMNNNFGFPDCQTQPQFNMQPQQAFTQKQSQPVSQPVAQPNNDMSTIIQSLRPQAMTNPVKIVEPSYIVTEKQLQQMLALAQGNPNVQMLPSQPQPQQQVLVPGQYQPQQVIQPESKSWFDELGNITFGTVGRIGHTLTDVASGVIDILTLGYAQRK